MQYKNDVHTGVYIYHILEEYYGPIMHKEEEIAAALNTEVNVMEVGNRGLIITLILTPDGPE